MAAIGLLFLLSVILSVGYGLYSTYCTWSFFRHKTDRDLPDEALPPVSILKPIAGLGEGQLENFESFCLQDYPAFEMVFAFPAEGAKLIPLLQQLRARFPGREIRWVAAAPRRGPNYKVGNLIAAVKEARHPVLVISDADMRVGPDYLRRTVGTLLKEEAGLVTSLYRNTRIANLFAALQALTVQTGFTPSVLFSRKVEEVAYAFGASICTRKETLEALGGMEGLLDYLADDYQMGRRVHASGLKVRISRTLLDQVSRVRSFRQYLDQQLRAGITQRVCRPLGYLGSVITHQVSLALLFSLVEKFSPFSTALLAAVCVLRILASAFLNRTSIHNRELGRYLWLVPVNDVLNTLLWAFTLFGSSVQWKGRRFRVLKGGRMVEERRKDEG